MSATALFATTLGLAAGGEALSFFGQQQMYKENAKSAEESQINQAVQDSLNVQQQDEANAIDLQNKGIEAALARSTAIASAGEAGVSGNSVDMLIRDYNTQESRYRGALEQQARMTRAQSLQRQRGYRAEAQSRINSVQQPNVLASALNIGGKAVSAHTAAYGVKRPNAAG
jgi:hypothetical protein